MGHPWFSLPLWSLEVGERLRVIARDDGKVERVSEGRYEGRLPLRLSGGFSVECRRMSEPDLRRKVAAELARIEALLLPLEAETAEREPVARIAGSDAEPTNAKATAAQDSIEQVAALIGWSHPVTTSLVHRVDRLRGRARTERRQLFEAAYAKASSSSEHAGLKVDLTRVRCSVTERWPNRDALDVLASTIFTLGLGAQLEVQGCGFELSVTNTTSKVLDAAPLISSVFTATLETAWSTERIGHKPTVLAPGASQTFLFYSGASPAALEGKSMLVMQKTWTGLSEVERVLAKLR